jgi:hypothetical protein
MKSRVNSANISLRNSEVSEQFSVIHNWELRDYIALQILRQSNLEYTYIGRQCARVGEDKKCIQNFGDEISRKTGSWKTEEMRE